MKRILAIVLAGVMGVLLTTGDASAWKRGYRYRSYQGYQGYHHGYRRHGYRFGQRRHNYGYYG